MKNLSVPTAKFTNGSYYFSYNLPQNVVHTDLISFNSVRLTNINKHNAHVKHNKKLLYFTNTPRAEMITAVSTENMIQNWRLSKRLNKLLDHGGHLRWKTNVHYNHRFKNYISYIDDYNR